MSLSEVSISRSDECDKPSQRICAACCIPLKVRYRSLPRNGLTWIRFPHTVSQVRRGATAGCPLCRDLLEAHSQRGIWKLIKTHLLGRCTCCTSIKERARHVLRALSPRPFQLVLMALGIDDPEISSLISVAHLDCGADLTGTSFNAYTYTDDAASRFVPTFDTKVDGEQTISDIKRWLSTCECVQKAQTAGQGRFKPSRVVDIGDSPGADVLVTSTSELDITSYACLSYVWGGPQAPTCSTSNFLPSQSWMIPYGRIPAAFRDAFTVARSLGIRYVWIDSLCIIQDSPEDLRAELLDLPNIFKYAELTICASSSKNPRDGFLQQRPDHSERQITIELPEGSSGTVYMDTYNWHEPKVPEPLSQRAWAFQERHISPRLLEYGWRTSRWVCHCQYGYSGRKMLRIESKHDAAHPKAKHNYKYFTLFSFLNPPGARWISPALLDEDAFFCWIAIVEEYSSRSLTFPEDRLTAISGIAMEVQRSTGLRYLAGVWDHERLPSFIQWKIVSPLSERQARPESRRAPSWSWAAIDASVTFQASKNILESFKIVQVEVSGDFNPSIQGFMRIQGPARRCSLSKDSKGVAEVTQSWGSHVAVTRQDGRELVIWPDCAGEIVRHNQDGIELVDGEVALLAATRANIDPGIVRGLILRQDEACKDGEYRRVGYFQARDEGDFVVGDWAIEDFIIS